MPYEIIKALNNYFEAKNILEMYSIRALVNGMAILSEVFCTPTLPF